MVKKITLALAGLTPGQVVGGSMAGGIASLAVGVALVAGIGFGAITLGVCLVGLAFQIDRNA